MTHALTGLGITYAGKLWLGHEMAAALVLNCFFSPPCLAGLYQSSRLYRALEGHGRANEFEMRRRNYGSRPIPALRFPQSRTCALMTRQLERLYRK
jgi:hypothetical protein